MEKLISSLEKSLIFKRIDARQKLLAYLYFAYLTIPLRNKMKKDTPLSQYGKSSSLSREKGNVGLEIEKNAVNLPRLPRYAVIFYFISTGTNLFAFLLSIFLKIKSVSKNQIADDSITCYMPRVHVHELLSQRYMHWFGIMYTFYQLLFRAFMLLYGSKFRLDTVTFLLIDESDLSQYWQGSPPSEVRDYTVEYSPESLLFIRVESLRSNKVHLLLRPNRTPKSRETLMRLIDSGFIPSIVGLAIPVLLFGSIIISQILFRHEAIYEGCRISYYDSVYWLRTLTSLHVCLVILFDSFMVQSFPAALGNLIIEDLIQYWNAIEEKMSQLRMKLARLPHNGLVGWLAERKSSSNRTISTTNIEQECAQVRALIGDFFKNLIRTNELVSMGLVFVFFVWLSGSSVVTFLNLQLEGSSNIMVRLFQMTGIVTITILSYLAMQLKRRTEPAYSMICTLMALDDSQSKTEWIEILEHYTDKRSFYAFTMPGFGVFDTLLFIQIVSYILSLTIFVEQYQTHVTV